MSEWFLIVMDWMDWEEQLKGEKMKYDDDIALLSFTDFQNKTTKMDDEGE